LLAFGDCASASSAVLNSRPVYADAFCEYTDVDLTEPPAHAPTPEG
jgi:hypothetical protein